MSVLIRLPLAGANDEFAEITAWLKKKDEFVNKGDLICAIETTKAVMDIEAIASGYLVPLVEAGKTVRVGEPLAAVTDSLGEDVSSLLAAAAKTTATPARTDRRWTKKAEMMAGRHGIDLSQLWERHGGKVIGEAEVKVFLGSAETATSAAPQNQATEVVSQAERVLILGGASGGGAGLVLDALSRIPSQRAVGVLDRDPELKGKSILNVPVLGPTSMAEELWNARMFDGAIIAFNSNLDERAALFEDLSRRGVRFTNVVDVTAMCRLNVRMGTGNIILAACYLGPWATIGDNNFLSSHTCIEHHCSLGSHCAFGPSVTFSGRVTVGDKVSFATNIAVEPDINIGDDAVIASGAILTRSIPANSIVKARVDYTIRTRQPKAPAQDPEPRSQAKSTKI